MVLEMNGGSCLRSASQDGSTHAGGRSESPLGALTGACTAKAPPLDMKVIALFVSKWGAYGVENGSGAAFR